MNATRTIRHPGQTTAAPITVRQPVSVWLLTNAPSPYQAELLSQIARHGEVDLTVRLMRPSSSSGTAVSSRFPAITMSALAPRSWRDEIRLHPRALWEAAFGRFDCYVLSGLYTSITFLCCMAILAIRRKPRIVWFERPRQRVADAPPKREGLVPRTRDRVRTWVLRTCTELLCIGTAARDEYAAMGVDRAKLAVLPYCCNIARYDAVQDEQIRQFRVRNSIESCVVFLFSGQLVQRKGVDTLLSAFQRLADQEPQVHLLILGDGPLRSELESTVSERHRNRIQFLGHLPQEELPTVFRAANVFVFPSRHDGWGVVINEACAAGLPIIASEQTGAAYDLVEPDRNGFRHPADDADRFYASMETLFRDAALRMRMGKRSRELVEELSPRRGAERFASIIRKTVERA